MVLNSILQQFWSRTGTTLSPLTAGDNLLTTGTLGAGAITGTSLTASGLTVAGIVKNSAAGLLSTATLGTDYDNYFSLSGAILTMKSPIDTLVSSFSSTTGITFTATGFYYTVLGSTVATFISVGKGAQKTVIFGDATTDVDFDWNATTVPMFKANAGLQTITIGDGGTTNYARFTATGALSLVGSATLGVVGLSTLTGGVTIGAAGVLTMTTNDLTVTCAAQKTILLTTTVYDDLQFQVAYAKVTPNNLLPSWEAFTTNTSEYAFAVDEEADTAANELPHWWKQGTVGNAHIHITTKAVPAQEQKARFTVTFAYADSSEVWVEAPLTAELTIPISTTALTNFYLDLGDLTLTNYLIGAQIRCRIKRVAKSAGGTEYAGDIFVTQVGIHLEKDTMGSRQETTK